MFKKRSSSIGLPRTLSLQETFTFTRGRKRKDSLKNDHKPLNIFSKSTIPIDKYYTNEGHQLLSSYLKRLNQVQNHIIKGSLHKITEKDVDDLIKSYDGIPTPVYETLSYQELNLSAHECKLLAKLLKADTITNIRNLKLAKNHLFGSSVKTILESLQKNTTVKTLDLSFNHLTDNEANWVGKLLKKNNTIKEIYLAHNRIGSDGANNISKGLMINNSVERLSLESNQLNSNGGIRMANMLKVNKTIKYIHLGSNNLQLEAIKAISESLKFNDKLISLSLDINSITPEGAKSLGESLEINQTLTHLYIPRNDIGDEGLKCLCQSLRKNTTLIYLDIEFNCIGLNDNIDGASALGDLLENNNVPKAINISQNIIGDEGCEKLFKGLHKNTSLESIILSRCSIGLNGINAIAQSLKLNTGLQNISLNKNSDMGADGHLVLADALKLNTTLKGIQLDYNFVEWDIISNSIQQSLTRNHILQKERYNSACNVLTASRILLNPTLDQQLPSCSTSPLMSPIMSPMMSSLMSSPMIPLMSITPLPSPTTSPRQSAQWLKKNRLSKKREFTKLPFEIQEHIIAYLDTKNVLTKDQILEIIDFSMKKSTLNCTREEFFKKSLSAYYPLTIDVRLWPTEATDIEFDSSERF